MLHRLLLLLCVVAGLSYGSGVFGQTLNPANGHYYLYVPASGIHWKDAKIQAESMTFQGLPGYLATITSQTEQDFIAQNLSEAVQQNAWLGGYQDGSAPDYVEPSGGWRWVTGEKWDYTHFEEGEPNNFGGNEDYLHFYGSGFRNDNWNDLAEAGDTISPPTAGFIVEFAIPVKLVIPPVLTGGNTGIGTVLFSSPVDVDTEVSLASSSPKVASVPTSVTVLAGEITATFLITTSKVKADTPVTLSASLNGFTWSEKLIVTPTSLTSITLNPTAVLSGKSVTGTVKLSKAAPADGWLVALSSDSAVAPVPASVLVPAGANFARFTITTLYPDAVTIANISAMFGGTTKTAPLTVNPLTPVSLTLTPTTVFGGTSVSVKLTINALAPFGGKTVTLSSGNSAANCPASVVVPAGKSSVTFKITTGNPAATTTGDISATLGGVTINAPLTVNHSVVTKLSVAFLPKASRYARGTVITLQATLLDETGTPIVGKTVTLKEYVSALGTRTTLGSLTTDANGQVQLTYTVPTDPAKDNVYIEAYFVGDVGYLPASKASKRIPIGT